MARMKDRTKQILESGIEYFIRTGEPITSERLYGAYDFGIKPAMIRCELNELGSQGFFEQGHPSGGRRPTHKAYRLFVDGFLSGKALSMLLEECLPPAEELLSFFLEGERRAFVEDLSDRLDVLGAGYAPKGGELYQSGLSSLLGKLDTDAKEEFVRVAEDLESLGERLDEDRWWERESVWPRVFVGRSPFTKSRHLSVIADRLSHAGDDFLVLAIGPNRMDYEKSIAIFKALEDSLSSMHA